MFAPLRGFSEKGTPRKDIEALLSKVGISGFNAYDYPEGYPVGSSHGYEFTVRFVAQQKGVENPIAYASLIGFSHTQADQLQQFLGEHTDLKNGVDYIRHGGGQRGGMKYFELITPDSLGRLQSALAEAAKSTSLDRTAGSGGLGGRC